ncbi:MAG TPA: glycerophosphodiester phosphodiesterase family protein [Novosphingobium sp.]|nr:glycerophosphodiester phosphodiesterase family protein [Novosphingobium sp.]
MPSLPFALLDRWLTPAPTAKKVGWLGEWSYAHRGLHGAGVPENSPGAFAAAIARGMGIECDVQRSSDGQAMVFHDFELDRLTGESGPIERRSAGQLSQIVLSGSSDTIPGLRQLLDQVAGQVPLLIEIKSGRQRRSAALCLAVRRVLEGYRGPHAVMSFDPRVVGWFATHAPLTVRGLVVTEQDAKTLSGSVRRRLALWYAKPDFLAYDIRDLPSRFAAAQRKRGLPVMTWTVRSPEHLARAALHADAPIAEGAGVS